ncbi:hypothetical protein [Dermatobacter hominis]|uniref:hypothetical protein n=1 Tax=Dermatobacter hominis TaxID=2884263 RepID=UPI001D11F703|nr:hypothetical protein [Dermatobacter hominis]UDY36083.1 hypothetical protein LH044_00775 [Dermatobacter hominis]
METLGDLIEALNQDLMEVAVHSYLDRFYSSGNRVYGVLAVAVHHHGEDGSGFGRVIPPDNLFNPRRPAGFFNVEDLALVADGVQDETMQERREWWPDCTPHAAHLRIEVVDGGVVWAGDCGCSPIPLGRLGPTRQTHGR